MIMQTRKRPIPPRTLLVEMERDKWANRRGKHVVGTKNRSREKDPDPISQAKSIRSSIRAIESRVEQVSTQLQQVSHLL